LPASAITSAAVGDVISLSGEARMLLAMLTILRGYDGLALLEKQRMLQLPRILTGSCQKPPARDGTV
jgi:hypothetical protein